MKVDISPEQRSPKICVFRECGFGKGSPIDETGPGEGGFSRELCTVKARCLEKLGVDKVGHPGEFGKIKAGQFGKLG